MNKTIGVFKLANKYIQMVIELKLRNVPRLMRFYASYRTYKRLAKSEHVDFFDLSPFIADNTPKTPFDAHYLYQGVWAFKKIRTSGVTTHVDVGSEVRWAALLSGIVKVTFIDIRPFETDLKELTVKKGDILNMPFEDSSVTSLSCLHVAEHIGLGRYGDNLDPQGTENACKELSRVLATEGNLYFSLPVGIQKTHFNGHRVHFPRTIIKYFKGLNLVELSGVTDSGHFIENIDIGILETSGYACGLFHFRKEK